jgi:5-methylcytosine-specific restriction endonuclease McrA
MLKRCTKCKEMKPATREVFGGTGTGTGNLKGKCRVCMNADSRNYEKANKEGRRARDAKRADTGPQSRKSFGGDIKKELFRKQSGICICCFKSIEHAELAEVDHCVPLSRGGSDDESNYLLAHKQCNKEKHNKTLQEHWDWRVTNGLDDENLGVKHGLIRL